MFFLIIQFMMVLILVMISVAFFSLFERKLMGASQYRLGPNKVGVGGFLQPFSDMFKLFSKTESNPENSISAVYYIAPMISLLIPFMVWLICPIKWLMWTTSLSLMITLFYFSVSVYGVIIVGWFSNSKYAILGSVRASAQSISYEVGLTMGIITIILSTGCTNFLFIFEVGYPINLLFPYFFISVILGIIFLAETNRSPFDLAEGESDLVSGFNVEYGGISYSVIYMGESVALLWISVLWSEIFFHNATLLIVVLFVWLRTSLPRNRFDKVMSLFWLVLLPLTLCLMCVYVL